MNTDPIWSEALELISEQVNEGTFRIWFEPTVGLGLADGVYFLRLSGRALNADGAQVESARRAVIIRR